MTFTEKTHAFIAAAYYRELSESFGERGMQAFLHGTKYYGEQRGRRMAQRCIRDGRPLTVSNYYRYGEWMSTKEMVKAQQANKSTVIAEKPDRVTRITVCPWAAQFREMGLNEVGGAAYCSVIDVSLVRGFNPELSFVTEQSLQTEDCCIQRMRNSDVDADTDLSRNLMNMRGFGYHCAHMYYAYKKVVEAIFGEEGAAIADKVLRLYGETYGKADAEYIQKYADTDFSRCDSKEM